MLADASPRVNRIDLFEAEGIKNGIVFCNRKRDVDVVAKSLKSHGFSAAAQVYFGKKARDLTVAEMATLAGLPASLPQVPTISCWSQAVMARSAMSSTAC